MDLVTQAQVERIKELAGAVLRDSQRRAQIGTQGPTGQSASLDLSDGDVQRYKLSRVISAMLPGPQREAAHFENECANELRKRFDVPLGWSPIPSDALQSRAGAGYLVGASAPSELSFIDTLRAKSVVFRLGAQRLEDLKDDIAIPRGLADVAMSWPGMTGSVTAADPTLGQVSATPKRGCALVEVSEQLFRQPAAERVLRVLLAGAWASGLDSAVINGLGGAEPLGILATPGVGSLSGANLAYAGLVGVQKTVADLSAALTPESCAYLTTPTVAELLKTRQRFTNTDSPLWKDAIHGGTIEGVTAIGTKLMPAATALYGDFSTIYVCEWGPMMLRADRGGTRFNTATVGIRAQQFLDVIITPSSFVKITSIT